MRWHRNPFFHTAVLPPSVAPSVRPSADLDRATAANATATAAAPTTTTTTTTDQTQTQASGAARASTDGIRVSFSLPPGGSAAEGQDTTTTSGNETGTSQGTSSGAPLVQPAAAPAPAHAPPHGLLAEATARLAAAHGHDLPRHGEYAQNHQQQQPDDSGTDSPRASISGGVRRSLSVLRSSIGAHLPHLHHARDAPRRPVPKLTIAEPSDHLTAYQAFYIFGLDGLGACVLSGGINFAIAYAMYKTIDIEKHPIRLFQFPNTIAGDAALTIFLQCVITWFIELLLVNRDLRSGHIQPIGFIPEPSNPLLRWFLLLDRQAPRPLSRARLGSSGSGGGGHVDVDVEAAAADPAAADATTAAAPTAAAPDDASPDHPVEKYAPGSWQHWAAFLVSQLIRALLVGVVAWILMWPASIGIMTAVGQRRPGSRDWWFDDSQGAHLSWAGPIFKLVYGGVLALLTTPPFAAFWLVRCGWAIDANHRHLATVAA